MSQQRPRNLPEPSGPLAKDARGIWEEGGGGFARSRPAPRPPPRSFKTHPAPPGRFLTSRWLRPLRHHPSPMAELAPPPRQPMGGRRRGMRVESGGGGMVERGGAPARARPPYSEIIHTSIKKKNNSIYSSSPPPPRFLSIILTVWPQKEPAPGGSARPRYRPSALHQKAKFLTFFY